MLGSSSFRVLAQTPASNKSSCGFDYKLEELLLDPQNKAAYNAFTAKYANLAHTASAVPLTEYFIPYVIHDIYESAADKLTVTRMGVLMAKVQIKLDLLLAAHNVKITLIKATDCDVTFAGFIQKQIIPSTDLGGNKAVFLGSRLPAKKYLNIWFLQELNVAPGIPRPFAYANFPSSAGLVGDGIVVSKPDYVYDLGDPNRGMDYIAKNMAHELGHYLGLNHPWGDIYANVPENCTIGDGISDTEPCHYINGVNMDCATFDFKPHECIMDPLTMQHYPYPKRNLMGYTNCGDELTAGQVDRIVAVLKNERKELAENGLILSQSASPITIQPVTTTVTFDKTTFNNRNIVLVNGDIIVKRGANLTIDKDLVLSFQPDAKLIIEQGAIVYLNGKLTSSCQKKWKGVDVVGNNTKILAQFGAWPAVQDNSNVGVLYCKKESTIENAKIAVACGVGNRSGGIVYASEANFINNNQTIVFAPYRRVASIFLGPMPLLPYRSAIDKCNFEINKTFLYTLSPDNKIDVFNRFSNFITINGVKGISITHSNFKVLTNQRIFNAEEAGYGIKANDGSMIVDDCTFESVLFGIKSIKTRFNEPYFVSNSTFKYCGYGISNNNVDGTLVENSTFYLGPQRGWFLNTQQFGTHYEGIMDMFTLRKNSFIPGTVPKTEFSSFAFIRNYVGSYFTGTGMSTEAIVTGNMYESCGTAAQNMRLFQSGVSGLGTQGVRYYCNMFKTTKDFDIYVDDDNQIYANHGQVDNTVPNKFNSAGNIFANTIDIRMSPSAPVFYCYSSKAVDYPDALQDWDKLWKTPSDDQRILKDPGTCPYKKFTLVDQTLEDLKAEFTEEDQMWQTAQDDLLDIDVNDKPAYRQGLIAVGYHRAKMESLVAEILERYKNSTNTEYQSDSLIVWWGKVATPSADIQIVHEHIARGNFSAAHQVLATMAQRHQLSTGDAEDFRRYGLLIDYLQDNVFENLTNSQLNYIYSNFIENSPYVVSRSLGQNIMTTYGSFFMPDYQAAQVGNSGELENPVESKVAKVPTIMVAPNPAKDFTIFYWNSDKIIGKSLLLFISDATGKQLLSNIVSKESSNYEWNTSNLAEGIYFYQILLDNGLTLQSGKIIVQK
jgi:hypothetical protein